MLKYSKFKYYFERDFFFIFCWHSSQPHCVCSKNIHCSWMQTLTAGQVPFSITYSTQRLCTSRDRQGQNQVISPNKQTKSKRAKARAKSKILYKPHTITLKAKTTAALGKHKGKVGMKCKHKPT